MIQVEGIFAGGATKPYIEETYDSAGNLIDAKLYGYTKIRDGMFSGLSLSNIILPTELVSIGNFSFSGCENLSLNSLPAGVTSIGDYAFDSCYVLSLTSLPDGIDRIGSAAFNMCEGLTELTFMGTPTSIASNAFENCINLTTINVPWAEGAVANAPWGATNATIHYNYTGG